MFCPKCGVRSQDGSVFCHNCGADLTKILTEEVPLSADIENVQKYASMRKATDAIVSVWWVMVPAVTIAAYLASTVYNVFSLFGVFRAPVATSGSPLPNFGFFNFSTASLAILLPQVVFLYLFYVLIKRRNQHFERQQRLFRALNLSLRKIAFAKGMSGIERYSSYIESSLRGSVQAEREKSAAFWAILLIIPVVQVFVFIYILYFLNEDFHSHELRENYDLTVFGYQLQLMGFSFSFSREHPVQEHSFFVHLILTIVTLGVFSIYWDYLLIKEPNGHFADQRKIEETLLENIMPLLTV